MMKRILTLTAVALVATASAANAAATPKPQPILRQVTAAQAHAQTLLTMKQGIAAGQIKGYTIGKCTASKVTKTGKCAYTLTGKQGTTTLHCSGKIEVRFYKGQYQERLVGNTCK